MRFAPPDTDGMPVGHAGHEQAEPDVGGDAAPRRERGVALEALARSLAVHRLEVVEAPDAVEAELVGESALVARSPTTASVAARCRVQISCALLSRRPGRGHQAAEIVRRERRDDGVDALRGRRSPDPEQRRELAEVAAGAALHQLLAAVGAALRTRWISPVSTTYATSPSSPCEKQHAHRRAARSALRLLVDRAPAGRELDHVIGERQQPVVVRRDDHGAPAGADSRSSRSTPSTCSSSRCAVGSSAAATGGSRHSAARSRRCCSPP